MFLLTVKTVAVCKYTVLLLQPVFHFIIGLLTLSYQFKLVFSLVDETSTARDGLLECDCECVC